MNAQQQKTPEERAYDRAWRQTQTVFEALRKVVPAEDHPLLGGLRHLVEDAIADYRRAVTSRSETRHLNSKGH